MPRIEQGCTGVKSPAGSQLFIFMLVLFLLAFLGRQELYAGSDGAGGQSVSGTDVPAREVPERIISLAPSITEILFMLGLGDKVVGVTRYCTYPARARDKAKVGGYCDPGYEALVALEPDLVIMLPEHEEHRQGLCRLGLTLLAVDHRSVNGILESITAIGKACGRQSEAAAAVCDLRSRMNYIRSRTSGLPQPQVLVSVGRNMGSGRIKDACIAGRSGFYDDLIRLAGGVNAYEGAAAYPVVSEEGIIRINPEIIIDMVPDLDGKGLDVKTVLREWQSLIRVDAVRNGRVHVFDRDYTVIPGPRFILILEDMARVIHPEAARK